MCGLSVMKKIIFCLTHIYDIHSFMDAQSPHSNSPDSKRTSDILHSLITDTRGDGEISINNILAMLGERAFGLAILIFTLPNSLPIPSPPGFSAITGIPIVLLGLQMILGMPMPKLPKRIGEYALPRHKFAAFMEKALPYIQKVEKLLHPRFSFMQSTWAERAIGAFFFVLGIILSLPIPFANFFPGLCMSLIALGLLERDGILMLIGMISGLATTILLFTALDVVVNAVSHFLSNMF